MANHPSAQKRNRQRIKRTARNRAASSAVRTHVKRVRTALSSKDKPAASTALKTAISQLDRAASKGVMHRKAVSRTISRLAAQVHKLSKTEAAPVEKKAEKKADKKKPAEAKAKAAKKGA